MGIQLDDSDLGAVIRPFLSVLMTTFNASRFLNEAVESILQQDYSDFEFIVVDDGSTDQTRLILDQLSASDRRMRIMHIDHAGISTAANIGLSACVGKIIARMDGDDVAKPHRFRTQLEYLRQVDAVCVGSFVDFIDAKGRFLTTIESPVADAAIQEALLAGHTALWQTGAMFRREAVERIGGYDKDFDCAQDLDLWLRLGEIGRLGNVPQSLQCYRLHHQAVSETKRDRQHDLCLMACERAWKRRGVRGRFKEGDPWRPGKDRYSRQHCALRYGWWAFNSGHRRTALNYGVVAVLNRPIDLASWRLLLCAAVKRCPRHGAATS